MLLSIREVAQEWFSCLFGLNKAILMCPVRFVLEILFFSLTSCGLQRLSVLSKLHEIFNTAVTRLKHSWSVTPQIPVWKSFEVMFEMTHFYKYKQNNTELDTFKAYAITCPQKSTFTPWKVEFVSNIMQPCFIQHHYNLAASATSLFCATPPLQLQFSSQLVIYWCFVMCPSHLIQKHNRICQPWTLKNREESIAYRTCCYPTAFWSHHY